MTDIRGTIPEDPGEMSAPPQRSTSNVQTPLVVIKVGGSLLALSDLAERLRQLIEQRPGIRPVLIVGGGAAANAVRCWSGVFSLNEVDSHELAIQSMNLTAALLHRIMPETCLVSSLDDAEACWSTGEWPVLRMETWLATLGCCQISPAMPASWDVTSDSLSAAVAVAWHAEELWLLKSTDLPAGALFTAASRNGLVDAFFPQLASQVASIWWCNARADVPTLACWSRWDAAASPFINSFAVSQIEPIR